MRLKINDWEFDIDLEATREHSSFAATDHCNCAYCQNYYRAVSLCYPSLGQFLKAFGLQVEGPVEMYPFEPTVYLAGYRVRGKILKFGAAPMMVDGIPVAADPRQEEFFMLEVGEMALPWLLQEDPDEVISPANEPEFLEKMYRKRISRDPGYTGLVS